MVNTDSSGRRSGMLRLGDETDEARLEYPRDMTFSKFTSVVGDDIKFVLRFDFLRFIVLKRDPRRAVKPRNGESMPFFEGYGALVYSPSLRQAIS